jgi:hypothetical protein
MHRLIPLCAILLAAGCAEESKKPRAPGESQAKNEKAAAKSPSASLESVRRNKKGSESADAVQRKIIYTATVNLVVEHFDPVPAQVEALANRFDAYVARSQLTGSPGVPRHGQWTLRVAADRYEAFLAAARELGEVQDVTSDSQDVTEEYYDVEARMRNKKQEETRLLDLLSKATGKLEEVLSVERELSRVREEIETMEGRLRVLGNLTALSTVHLNVSEIKDYVPEQAVTFATRIRRAWDGSLAALVVTAQALSVFIVVLTPWLGILFLPALAIVVALRIYRTKGRR